MKLYLFNTFTNLRNKQEFISAIVESIKSNKKKTFFGHNSQSIYLIKKNELFASAINKFDFTFADGLSISIAAKILLNQRIKKIALHQIFNPDIKNLFTEKNYSIFCLGTTDKVLNKFKEKYSDLNIVGLRNGYFDKTIESELVIAEINKTKPNILLVGMGMPLAEIWIQNNIDKLNANCIISVGGAFDNLSGEKKIAPKYVSNIGLEWLYRLIQEPIRLTPRYLVCNSYFLKEVVRLKIISFFK